MLTLQHGGLTASMVPQNKSKAYFELKHFYLYVVKNAKLYGRSYSEKQFPSLPTSTVSSLMVNTRTSV